MSVQYLVGQSLDVARTLPDASVNLVATSPPFLALRNYNDLDGQIGAEATPADFIDTLLELATEWRRVLTPDGSIAVELGDTYSGKSGWGSAGDDSWSNGAGKMSARGWRSRPAKSAGNGWPLSKSLTGIPTLFAWSLAYGRNLLNPEHTFEPWRIRNVIVWARNNPPVGALGDKVRPSTSYITVATPSAKRWFDLDAVRGDAVEPKLTRVGEASASRGITGGDSGNPDKVRLSGNPAGAPPNDCWRDEYDGDLTWLVNTQGSSLAHYAMWPAKLAERLVLSMCPEGGTVLDPFAGTGTTLAVADIHGRHAIGIDLDPANELLYPRRYDEVKKSLTGVAPELPGQTDLFGGAA